MSVDPVTLAAAIEAALQTQANLDVNVGVVDANGEPTYRLDGDGRVHMTAVLHPGVGSPDPLDEAVDGSRPYGVTGFQVTAVGGDTNRALRAAMKVRAALTGARLFPDAGPCLEEITRPVAIKDPTAVPARWFVPLLFTIDHPTD